MLQDDCFNFSETGAPFGKDFMSKHAMHANCAEEVYYAGEFVILKDHDQGCFKLIIDNNSGTFAPAKENLPKLKRVFERNFPFLCVEVLSFDDPQFKDYHARVKAFNEGKIKDDWI